MNNTKPSLIGMKPKDAIKLDTVQLNKTYSEESVLPEDGLYRYLHQPGEQNRDQKNERQGLSGVKRGIDQIELYKGQVITFFTICKIDQIELLEAKN